MIATSLPVSLAYNGKTQEMHPSKLALSHVVFQLSEDQLQEIRETNGMAVGLNVAITFHYKEKTFKIAQRKLSAVLSSIVRRSTNSFDAKFTFTKLTSEQRIYTKTLLRRLV